MRKTQASRVESLLDAVTGLTGAQAHDRQARYGANDIVEAPPSSWRDLLRDTARDPMLWFLCATSLLFASLGDYAEAGVLAFALLPIAGMDAYLHRRMRASTQGLAERIAATACVKRDGAWIDVGSRELVPGDLVAVAEGESIPADGIVMSCDALRTDESVLTGEAMPVSKTSYELRTVDAEEISVDETRLVYAGTRALTGKAHIRVTYTGGETRYGEIVRSLGAYRHERTPLQEAIDSLVKILLVAALAICVALAATRLHQGHGLVDAIVSSVTLAVAALPEEFPVVFTFFLGVGVYRLARDRALVKRAIVVENIGRVTCICSDKTGTLTEGRLRLMHTILADGIDETRLLEAAATASRSGSGDPLDVAIGRVAERPPGTVLATFPFTEQRRREVALLRTLAHSVICAAKGAPETIISMSSMARQQREEWLAKTRQLATMGQRVIAVCDRTMAVDASFAEEPDGDFTFLGLLAFADPLRDRAADAVAIAQRAGIRVIMITGDHPATSQAVAAELGLGGGVPHVVEGENLRRLLAQGGAEGVRDVDVVARASPAEKLALVEALQRAGEIVAVTGDGVNDAPALQRADIGIAMGERGTRTSREVAAIVLLDDNFNTIVRAIAEGRQLFRNLKHSFAYLLIVHIPLVLTAALIPFAGFPLLYLPSHIVWLELVIHPTAILAFQKAAPSGALEMAERRTAASFFGRRDWLAIVAAGTLVTVAVVYGYARGVGPEQGRSVALATLISASAAVSIGLSGLRSAAAWTLGGAALASAALMTRLEPIASLLHLSSLRVEDWFISASSGLAAGSIAALIGWCGRRPGSSS